MDPRVALAHSPSWPRRALAAPPYAVFAAGAAIGRALPDWWPQSPRWYEDALWWCWTTADRIAPGRASRWADAVLERGAADPAYQAWLDARDGRPL